MIRLLICCLASAFTCITSIEKAISAELIAGDEIVLARQFNIHSEILSEDRNLLVYLPASYGMEAGRERRYPVLYLLDGPAYFNATTGIVHHLADAAAAVGRIPEHIIVAIRNIRTSTKATRNRDMTPSHMTSGLYSENSGGAASFRAFLETELIPEIDSRFRTQKQRVLVGHSLAGLFTLDTLVERPQLFNSYVAIDPTASWDGNLVARKLKSRTLAQSGVAARVFIAEANSPHMTTAEQQTQRDGIRSFRYALEESGRPVQESYRYFADETHLSVPLAGIYAGLLSVYGDFKKP